MDNNSFWINLIAKLKKNQSKQQIKTDVKSLGDIFIKLTGKLDLVKTRKNIKNQLKDLNNNTFTITPTVNKKGVQNATKQAVDNAQKTANNKKIQIDFEVNKQKLINQIKILGRDNSKLFNNSEISAKYNQLLDSAKIAKSSSELKSLRGQLSAFRTELKATNNAGMTWIDKFKSSISSFAQYFSGASFIYAMTNQLKNAWAEAKTLDDRLVDLQKVTDEIADRDALYKYFDRAMSKAQELNVKVDSLLYAITEFKKLGWSLSDAELGGQWATILENVGDVNIDTAIGSIKTAIASFDEIGGYTNAQMDKKIEAYVDLINNMSNKYSIDAEGLSEAIRLSAGTLREAHTSIEQAATIFSTANRYFNDPDYLGNTLKIGSLRMRASSGDSDAISELEEMGEQIDDLAEATSNLRGQLLALTGVDIMVDEHTFKSYYDQLYEISQVIDDLNDTSRANVLETLFGKNRSAAGAAILSGMKESTDAYEEAINSAGSATKEYEIWMQSADAATQRFANNLTQMYQSIVNGNTVRNISNLGSVVLEFANNFGIVEGTIKGVIVLGLGKFLTTSTMAIITATKSIEQYGRALQLANSIPDGNLAKRYKALKDIAQATSLLTDAQKKQVLSSRLLSEQDRISILRMQGMSKELAAQKVAEMGLTDAINAQTAANTASTVSTFSLKSAMVGLGATIKSVFLSNPIGISLMAISVAISAVTSAVSKHNQKLDEMREKAKEAADKANTLGDEIADLAGKYISLSEAVKTDESAKEELITTQTELLKKLNLEGESIDSLIEKYGSLSNAIRQVSIDSLKDAQIDLIAGVDAARKELLDIGSNGFWSGNNIINATGEGAVKAFKELEKAGIIDSGSFGTGGGALVLTGDDKTVEGILENYKRLEDALSALRDSNAFTVEELSSNPLYEAIYGRYSELKDAVNFYNSAIDNLNENLAQQTMLTALQGKEIPKTEEAFAIFKQELIDIATASNQFIGTEEEIANAINNYLSSVPEFAGFYSIPLEEEINKVETLLSKTFNITTYEDQIDKIQSSIKTLRDALSSLNTGSLSEGGVLDLLQEFPELIPYVDMTAHGFGNLAEGLNELINAQPTELINSLYELRDAVNTEEEREQIDSLINSLQTLATYGDTGIEAYATTIGATWQNTADVIEGVTTQFENLAKVQEAVANGLTMSANTAAELAQMYPEILTNAEVTADGQVKLNEEVIKSILAGKDAAIEAQITQLEADKAVLTAKKEFAEAQLNMVKQVGEAEGNISLESAQYRINVANEVLKQAIEADEDEAEAYAEAIRVMSMNTKDFNVYVANVATDMARNIDNASVSMADSVATNTTNMQNSFQALKNKVTDVAKAIRAAWNGEVAGSDDIYSSSVGVKKGAISTNATRKDLNTYDFSWNPAELSLDQFTSQLELDIQGYQDAISNIDTQIGILRNLQQTFNDTANSANGGIGGHNYADKIKELEKEKDKINNALKDKKEDTYEELFDFFERRVDVLNKALNLLSINLDNVVGAFAKNNLLDAQKSLYAEEYKNYSDALAMYQQKANEALSKLPSDIAQKIKNGAVDITEFIGKGNEAVVDAIKDYEKWADKISDCSQELAELKTTLRKLELDKFNNIISDFTDQFDIRDKSIGLIDKQMALLEEAGELIGESFFTAQKEQAQKQLELLKQEQEQLADQFASALASGYVEQGSEEWKSMIDSLAGVEGSILDCQKSVEQFDNALLDLNWQIFDKIQNKFSGFSSELSNLAGLLDDIDVADDITGEFSKEALTKLGLYTQQYELARYQVEQYSQAMDDLKKDYLAGKYSTMEYGEKLSSLTSQQWEAVNAAQSMKDAIVDLNKTRINEVIEGIEKETDSFRKLTNSMIDALREEKALHDYEKSIADKTKSISSLQAQIEAVKYDTSASGVARRKKLEEQLSQQLEELQELQYQHSLETQEDALRKQLENYQQARNDEIDSLRESLKDQETLIAESFETVKNNADIIGQEIANIAVQHGITVSDTLISSWQSGENAIASYGEVLSQNTSAFIGNIMQVENETWNLQAQANSTADTLAYMFSTRADNLVNELAQSYYAEGNLNAMTQALHDSLVNTLEGGYNISSIVNALSSIADGANSVAAAANNASQALANMGATKTTVTTESTSSSKQSGGGGASGKLWGEAHVPLYTHYASGVRHLPNDEIAITQEDGTEMILSPVRGGMLLPNKEGAVTDLKKGDSVLTNEETDNIIKWSQFSPDQIMKAVNFVPQNIMPDFPKAEPRPVNNTIQIDNVLTVQGSIDNGNVKRMEQVAQKAINDAFGRFAHELKY